MKRKFSLTALLLAMLLLTATACQRQADTGGGGEEKPDLTIGLIGALTGDYAQLVVGTRDGAKLAIDEANASGDLPVRLTLQAEDSQGDKDKAVPLAQKFVADDKVIAIIGPQFSGESFAANPIIQGAGIPQVTSSATNPGLSQSGWKIWWRAVGNDNSQGGPAPDVINKYLKAKKVFIAHDKSAYGQGLADIIKAGMDKAAPGAVIGFEAVDPGKNDYSALASKIASSGADVFNWTAYSPEGGLIIKQAREKGFKGKFLGHDGSKDSTFTNVGGAAADGAILTCPCSDPTKSTDTNAKKFVDGAKKAGFDPQQVYAAEGYDSALLIIEAIKKAGKPGSDIKAYRTKVAENLRKTSGFKGATKTYSFQENGELVQESQLIYLYEVKGGKFEFLGGVEELAK